MLKSTLYNILVIFILFSCNTKDKKMDKEPLNKEGSHHNIEETILDRIEALPFVKKSNNLIDSINKVNGKSGGGISFIFDTLDKKKNEIHVRAGNNRDDRFETFYHFYVTPEPMKIKIYDVVSDSIILVEDYIKNHKD